MQFTSNQITNKSFIPATKEVADVVRKRKEEKNTDLETVMFFENLGCSIIDGFTANHTLIDSAGVTKNTVENNNIVKKVSENQKISSNTSFQNESDPFYEVSTNNNVLESINQAVEKTTIDAQKTLTLQEDLTTLNTSKVASTAFSDSTTSTTAFGTQVRQFSK